MRKKTILKILLISILTFILSFTFVGLPKIIKADSGFDADYDYGGSSGSYSSGSGSSSYDVDDDYSYHSSNNSDYSYHGSNNDYGDGSNLPEWAEALIYIVCFSPLIIYLIITIFGDKIRDKIAIMRSYRPPEIDTRGLKSDHRLNEEAFEIYKRVQIGWMNQNLESVRDLLTDEMYNMYLMQLDTLIQKRQKNIMSHIRFKSGHTLYTRLSGNIEEICLIMKVTCYDYIIDQYGDVIRGSEFKKCQYTYALTFIRNIFDKEINCPSCGHEIKGTQCPFCGNIVHQRAAKMVLSKKQMLSQYRRK